MPFLSKRSRKLLKIGVTVALVSLFGWAALRPEGFKEKKAWVAAEAKQKSPTMARLSASAPATAEQGVALESLMAGQAFVLVENGKARRFRLSLKEVYLPSAAVGRRLREVDPQPNARSLMALADRMAAGETPGWVLYPEDGDGIPEMRRILGTQILAKLKDRGAALAAVTKAGLRVVDEPSYASGYVIVEVVEGGPAVALRALELLGNNSAFESVAPLLRRQNAKKAVPDDLLFGQQWHLKNTGQIGGKAGIDVNAVPVWDFYKGTGVRIGIVDDGLDLQHPDLAANADSANHYDWNASPKDTNPAPDPNAADFHGTSVAGVAAARDENGIGVSGVAPRAKLVGFRLISEPTTDAEDAEAMTRGNDVIQIKNNSWGHADGFPWILDPPGPLFTAARKAATLQGRGGRGTILVWAAGNGRKYGDEGNKDSASNSMYAVVVGGVGNKGALTTYSEIGAHLTVVAPTADGKVGVVTTDLRGVHGYNDGQTKGELTDFNYTNGFGGTSSAAPVVAGVVALMLEANPNLGWRDVKEILLRSATKLLPTQNGWVSRTGGDDPTLPPIKHHQSYGGGLVNAQLAVALAKTWANLGSMLEESRLSNVSAPIPDNNKVGIDIPFDFNAVQPLRVENVTVKVNIQHSFRGDLEVKLRSPAGTLSTLTLKQKYDEGSNYSGWTFSSMRHWGESAGGTWILNVKDLEKGDTGSFQSATVTVYGTSAPAVQITSQTTSPMLLEEGQSLALNVATSGYGTPTHLWRRDKTIASTAGGKHAVASVGLTDAGLYQDTVTNLTGSVLGAAVPVGVVRRLVSPVTANEGGSVTMKAYAAGPGIKFQWMNGQSIVEDEPDHITGTKTDTLKVIKAEADDEGAYTCRVTLPAGTLTMDTLPATLTLRYKPVVTVPPVDGPGVVSGIASFKFSGDSETTKYAATGVPAGMVFDAKTGLLSGRPSKPGTYTVKVMATNAAGTSQPRSITWMVEDFPLAARGSFNGVVEKNALLNSDFGGRVSFVVANGGTYSGKITLGAKSYSVTGRVNALPGNADPSLDLSIARPKMSPLTAHLELSLANGTITGDVMGDGGSAEILAHRARWSTADKTAPAGTYNAVLALPVSLVGNGDYPQGSGYAALTVAPVGTVVWAGKLADGTGLTGSTALAADGEVSLHLMLYANTGSVQGWSVLNAETGWVDGDLGWWKDRQPDKSTTRSYKKGFDLHSLSLAGGKYNKPAPASILAVFSLSESDENNARLTFASGGLESDLIQDFLITTANAVKMPALVDLNPQAVKMTLNVATGVFSGSFAFKNEDPTDTAPPVAVITRKATFNGLLITRSGYNKGFGQFLLPSLPTLSPQTTAATSPVGSGSVILWSSP